MKLDKDTINALADALLGTGSAVALEPKDEQSKQKWFVCVPDLTGVVKKFETASLFQAKIAVEDWLASGHPAWLQDEEGTHLTIAPKPREYN
jgi:predicted RNase H-like HicB family nuclease